MSCPFSSPVLYLGTPVKASGGEEHVGLVVLLFVDNISAINNIFLCE